MMAEELIREPPSRFDELSSTARLKFNDTQKRNAPFSRRPPQ
jgi:hypothetical protein